MIKRLGTLMLLVVIGAGVLPVPAAEPVPVMAQGPDDIPAAAWARAIGEPFLNSSVAAITGYATIDDGPLQGAPLGGFGVGTIGRTYAGDFARWHLDVGYHFYQPLPSAMFSVYTRQGDQTVAQALWTGKPARSLEAWQWEYPVGAGTYYALYPRSWFVYDWDQLPVDLTVEQFSPVIPDDYQASSYPVALFNWTATNPTAEPVTVGVMFTMQNFFDPATTGLVHTVRSLDTPAGKLTGIEMKQAVPFEPEEFNGSMAIAALETPGVTVSTRDHFVTNGDGADIWGEFAEDGALDNPAVESVSNNNEDLWGAGIAITFTLEPGQTLSAPMAFAWDLPVMTFGPGESWYKRYTAFFGRDGDNAWDITAEGLAQIDNWRDAIVAWQEPILADESRPLWYKTALFNELYILADGGTAWEHGRVGEPDPGPDYLGRFAYLECFDYAYYNTFDVDFYASFALLELWPEIELSIMRDFAASIPLEDPQPFI
ncbi:MAG: glucosylceramidase, partial [Chloroflexi bacterium]